MRPHDDKEPLRCNGCYAKSSPSSVEYSVFIFVPAVATVPAAPGRGKAQVRVNIMGIVCAVRSCKNRSMHRKMLSFFRFPRDPDLCLKWITLCKRADLCVTFKEHGSEPLYRMYRVCSDHFQESDFKDQKLKSTGLKKNAVPARNLGPRSARECRKACKHSGNSARSERTTQSLAPEPPTADSPVELEIISFKVITGIDVDENADAHSASPPASPAFEYEKSPDSMLLDPSEEDAEIPACPDDFLLRREGSGLDHSNSESDCDDEVATMMNIDTLPLEGLRTSLRDLYRKHRRLKAVYLETVRLLEESSGKVLETAQLLKESTGKVERLEATLDELRARHCDAS